MEPATINQPAGPVVMVSYSVGALAVVSRVVPERSLVVVEEPDVLRKRNAYEATKDSPGLRELIGWEYLHEHAADAFYLAHRQLNPSAVVPINDYSGPFAARLAERYRVPGAGYGAAVIMRDKARQRAVTAAAGIPNPRSEPVDGPEQLRSFLTETGGPVVLKPANRHATLGTMVVPDPAGAAAAWRACLAQDEGIYMPDRPMPVRMLAEEFIAGEEFSVELMVQGGRTVFAAPSRKFLLAGARPVELGHVHPADLDPGLTNRLIADTERVIDAVGMDTGMVHCEWRVRDGVPYLVECNGRPGGGLVTELIELAWEYDIVREFYLMMRGLPLGAPRRATPLRYAAMLMKPAPVAGVITQVEGIAAAQAAPGVRTVLAEEVGARAPAPHSSDDMLTMITASGDTEQAACAHAQHANDLIRYTIQGEAE